MTWRARRSVISICSIMGKTFLQADTKVIANFGLRVAKQLVSRHRPRSDHANQSDFKFILASDRAEDPAVSMKSKPISLAR